MTPDERIAELEGLVRQQLHLLPQRGVLSFQLGNPGFRSGVMSFADTCCARLADLLLWPLCDREVILCR